MKGITNEQCIEMAKNLQFKGDQRVAAAKQIKRLYQLFCSVDATQVEINPFAETPEGRGEYCKITYLHYNICLQVSCCCCHSYNLIEKIILKRNYTVTYSFVYAVLCFDAKINFDDNAEFRQKEIFAMEEVTEEQDPREVEAAKHNLNYIGMDGNIGCLGEDAFRYVHSRVCME